MRTYWSTLEVLMVRLSATNLPSPAAPYLLEVKDMAGGVSWDRRTDIETSLVEISFERLSRRDIRELASAFSKLGPYRKVLVRLVPLESSNGVLTFNGYIKNLDQGSGGKGVTLELEECEEK